MPQERLNHADVDAFFDQQRCARVTEPVWGQMRFNPETVGHCPKPLAERGRADVLPNAPSAVVRVFTV